MFLIKTLETGVSAQCWTCKECSMSFSFQPKLCKWSNGSIINMSNMIVQCSMVPYLSMETYAIGMFSRLETWKSTCKYVFTLADFTHFMNYTHTHTHTHTFKMILRVHHKQNFSFCKGAVGLFRFYLNSNYELHNWWGSFS